MKNPRPAPVVVTTLCSLCGLGWERHGDDPTTADCIRLLKAELASRPRPITYPVYPYPTPYWGTWGTGHTVSTGYAFNTSNSSAVGTITLCTPRDDEGPQAVAA